MLTYTGTLKGVKTVTQTNRNSGETWDETYIGVSSPKTGGYDGEEIVRDIKLTKKQMGNRLDEYYRDLSGKRVCIEVFINNRASKDRVYSTWYLGGEGRPISIDGKSPPAIKAA